MPSRPGVVRILPLFEQAASRKPQAASRKQQAVVFPIMGWLLTLALPLGLYRE
jgi:hypothetical protein